MKQFVFITGNQHKVEYLEKWLGLPVEHHKVDLEELQSLDLREVVAHKARQAYEIVKRPVLVEDVAFTITDMGRLPGTFVKWFLDDIGAEGICKVADAFDSREAFARLAYAYYDGQELTIIEGETKGTVPPKPLQDDGINAWTLTKSWNAAFVPDGSAKSYAQMTDEEMKPFSHRAKAITKLQVFLQS